MAIIYSYQGKTNLAGNDVFVINDSADDNKTKNTTLANITTYIDNNLSYDLQQVLTAGATAYAPVGTGWNGQLKLGYDDGFGNDINVITIDSSSGATTAINIVGNTLQQGNHELKLNSSDFILAGGALTATAGSNTNIESAPSMDVVISPTVDFRVQTDSDISHQSRDFIGIYNRTLDLRATTSANLSAISGIANIDGNTINISASTITELKAGTNTIVSTDGSLNSTVNVGGTTSGNRADGVFVQAENFFQARTNTGQGKFYIIGGALPGADSDYINSVHPHTFMSEIRLGGTAATFDETGGTKLTPGTKGSAGAVGQLLSSRGSGASATWIDQDSIEPSQVVQLITNKSGVTLNYGDVVSIDPTPPNQAIPDVIKADNLTILPAVGIVSDTSIANNAEGKITKIGLIPDIPNTQFVGTTPVEGQIVYMAGGADAGKMTVDRPTGNTTGIQNVGIITRVVGSNFDVQVVAIGRTNALPNNDANALFTTNASNLPISTVGKLEVDVANNTVLIGDTAFNTDVDINANLLRVNADNGINMQTSANNVLINASAGITTIDSANNTVVQSDNDVSLYAPSGAAQVRGRESAIYALAVCASGSIPEGIPVKVTGENANGVLIVAEAEADNLNNMPCIGITAGTITPTGQGEIVMYGIHEFSSGTVISGGNVNDPIYVETTGGLTLSRPSGGSFANEITNQIVGRVIDPVNPDKILVTCTAAPTDRIIQGSIQPQLFNGGTAIPFLSAGTQGSFQVVGNEVSGIAKVTVSLPPVPTTLTGALTIRLNLPGGGLLGDISNFPPNTNYAGNLTVTECIMTDVTASPTVGAIATSDIVLKKPNGPHPDYTLSPNISTGDINNGDIITFAFKYWTES